MDVNIFKAVDRAIKEEHSSNYDSFVKTLYGEAKVSSNPQQTIDKIKKDVESYGLADEVDSSKYIAELEKYKSDPEGFKKVLMDWVVALGA